MNHSNNPNRVRKLMFHEQELTWSTLNLGVLPAMTVAGIQVIVDGLIIALSATAVDQPSGEPL